MQNDLPSDLVKLWCTKASTWQTCKSSNILYQILSFNFNLVHIRKFCSHGKQHVRKVIANKNNAQSQSQDWSQIWKPLMMTYINNSDLHQKFGWFSNEVLIQLIKLLKRSFSKQQFKHTHPFFLNCAVQFEFRIFKYKQHFLKIIIICHNLNSIKLPTAACTQSKFLQWKCVTAAIQQNSYRYSSMACKKSWILLQWAKASGHGRRRRTAYSTFTKWSTWSLSPFLSQM